jgi:hypothetical protein
MMFKILILQAWYALSDEALEKLRWVLFYQIGGFWLGYAKVSTCLK